VCFLHGIDEEEPVCQLYCKKHASSAREARAKFLSLVGEGGAVRPQIGGDADAE